MGTIIANLYSKHVFVLGGSFGTPESITKTINTRIGENIFELERVEYAIKHISQYPLCKTFGIWDENMQYRLDISLS